VTALFLLALITFVGLSIAAVLGVIFFLVRLVLWAALFPFRFLLKLLWAPVGLVLGALALVFGTIALPALFLIAGGIVVMAIVSVIASVLLPLLPFLLLGFALWALFRRRTAAV
jgi:hypothetical protein